MRTVVLVLVLLRACVAWGELTCAQTPNDVCAPTGVTVAGRLMSYVDASGNADNSCIVTCVGGTLTGTLVGSSTTQTSTLLDGAVHTDTLAGTVTRGDWITGNSTPKWSRHAVCGSGRYLRSDGTDTLCSGTAAGGAGSCAGATFVTATNDNAGPTCQAITLGTDTLGSYVESVATTAPLAGGAAGSEGAALTLTCNVASGAQPGCLSSADWTTFNGKISSGTCPNSTPLTCLAGRAGGQTVQGGTAPSESLTLESTTDTTKGTIKLKDTTELWTAMPTTAGTGLSLLKTQTVSANAMAIDLSPTLTFNNAASGFLAVSSYPSLTYTTSGANPFVLFAGSPSVDSSGDFNIPPYTIVSGGPQYVLSSLPGGAIANPVGVSAGFSFTPTLDISAAPGDTTIIWSGIVGVDVFPQVIEDSVILGAQRVTVPSYVGVNIRKPVIIGGAGETVTFLEGVGVEIADLTLTSPGTMSTQVSLRSSGTGATMRHAGGVRIGSTAAPTQKLEVLGNILVDNSGTAGTLRLREPSASGSNFTAFKAQAQAGDLTYTWPAADAATATFPLRSNGTGTLTWAGQALLDGAATTDTTASAVTRGDLIYGNSTPAWDDLAIGAASTVLKSNGTDPAWGSVSGMLSFSGSNNCGAATQYFSSSGCNTTATNVDFVVPFAFTMTGFACNAYDNADDVITYQYTLEKNGADDTTFQCTSTAEGGCTDIVGTVAFNGTTDAIAIKGEDTGANVGTNTADVGCTVFYTVP